MSKYWLDYLTRVPALFPQDWRAGTISVHHRRCLVADVSGYAKQSEPRPGFYQQWLADDLQLSNLLYYRKGSKSGNKSFLMNMLMNLSLRFNFGFIIVKYLSNQKNPFETLTRKGEARRRWITAHMQRYKMYIKWGQNISITPWWYITAPLPPLFSQTANILFVQIGDGDFWLEQPVKLGLWEISARLIRLCMTPDKMGIGYWLVAIISIITKQMTKDQDFPRTIKKISSSVTFTIMTSYNISIHPSIHFLLTPA